MASSYASPADMHVAMKNALGTHWRLFRVQGVLMVILGILAVAWPVVATLAVDIYVGWLFLISGVIGLVAMFSTKDIPAFLWNLVTAALSVAVGVLLLLRPAEGAVSLTLVLAAFFVAEGLFQIVTSVAYRDVIGSAWGWMIVSGLADLALAVLIVLGWPMSAAWVPGLLVGINLITSGLAILMTARAAREVVREVQPRLA
jgi:uncharacterized membrane protein HdeD (DUF308 family)